MTEDLFRLKEWGLEWRREDRGRKTRVLLSGGMEDRRYN
jgi:hypothetical protein